MENKKNTATNNPEMVTISREEYEELKLQNQWLLEQLGLAKKRQFGASSERLQEGLMDQLVLMANEAEAYSDNYTDTKTAEFTILAAPASGKVTITGADNKVGTELTASVTGNTHILFQFTPLREGRPETAAPFPAPAYFNSRPCERGDMQRVRQVIYGTGLFQFTPLREGRPTRTMKSACLV